VDYCHQAGRRSEFCVIIKSTVVCGEHFVEADCAVVKHQGSTTAPL